MATAANAVRIANHVLPGFRNNLPLHAFPWLVSRPCNLVKRLVQRQVVSDGILSIVSASTIVRFWAQM